MAFNCSMESVRILVVDDIKENINILSYMLESEKYNVIPALSGMSALEIVKSTLPDLIILDIQMPEMDGFTVCQKFKENPETEDIPIIFISALDSVDSKIKAFTSGGVDYITKPFYIEEVLARVKIHLCLSYLQKSLKKSNDELIRTNENLKRLSMLDPLTNIPNRRFFDKALETEYNRAAREGYFLSLIMIDIDFFKLYNDNLGHIQGDECLIKVTSILNDTLNRPGDLICRYGGEEFVVILPNTNNEGAAIIAEKMRYNINNNNIQHPSSPIADNVTISLGVSSAKPERDGNPLTVLENADSLLYKAKDNGRNQICVR